MSRPACSVPAVEEALVERLTTRLPDALVRRGAPKTVPTKRERVYVLGPEDLERRLAAQQGQRLETYQLVVRVEIKRRDEDDARARGWEVIEQIEADLEADPEVGIAASDAYLEELESYDVGMTDDGWLAQATIRVRVIALL